MNPVFYLVNLKSNESGKKVIMEIKEFKTGSLDELNAYRIGKRNAGKRIDVISVSVTAYSGAILYHLFYWADK